MNKTIITIGLCVTSIIGQAQLSLEIVKDINPSGNAITEFLQLVEYEDHLYFIADDGVHDREIWKTNGNEAGTALLKDINAIGSSFLSGLIVLDDQLFFAANEGINGVELWHSDGTETGTLLFKDINTAVDGWSSPNYLFVEGGKLYFSATDGITGTELWVSEGSVASTDLLKDINVGAGNSGPTGFCAWDGKTYFRASDADHGNELWVTDGTVAGTHLVKDINEGTASGNPTDLIVFHDKLYFAAKDAAHGVELWTSDGTEEGTFMFLELNPGAGISGDGFPAKFLISNDKLYFTAVTAESGLELWVSDGTIAGTNLVKDIRTGGGLMGNSSPDYLTDYNNKVYFAANDGVSGIELWVTDGTEAGTQLVKDITPGAGFSFVRNPVVYGGKLYFIAKDGTNGDELWVTDGTNAGTEKLTIAGVSGANPNSLTKNFTIFNGSLYFGANYNGSGDEVWKLTDTDAGAGTIELQKGVNLTIYPNPVTDILYIKTDIEIKSLSIIDITGKIMDTNNINPNQIDVSHLISGIYFLKVETVAGIRIEKFTKSN